MFARLKPFTQKNKDKFRIVKYYIKRLRFVSNQIGLVTCMIVLYRKSDKTYLSF
jgi:hypothetical protein